MRSIPFLKLSVQNASEALEAGSVIAHPAEGVYGLSCDPFNKDAVISLCNMKKRPLSMGLIIVGGSVEQILDLIDLNKLDKNTWNTVLSTWPGPVTWILPASNLVPNWIKGDHLSVGIRVSSHYPIIELTKCFNKPIVSTSANWHGHPPATTLEEISILMPDAIGYAEGDVGSLGKPTAIRDATSGIFLRN